MTLMRRPGRTMMPMRRMFDQLFTEPWLLGDGDVGMQMPSLDVKETDEAYVVEADLPGVKPDDVEVTVEGRMLTLRGRYGSERQERSEAYLVQERSSGMFARTISLPGMFDASKVTSEYADGVLRISLPKAPESRARRIMVQPGKTIEGEATPTPQDR